MGLTRLQMVSRFVPMTFTLTLVRTVRHRNMVRTVLCMGLPLWKSNDRPDMLFEIRIRGSDRWTWVAVLTKLMLQPLRLLTFAVMVKTPGLKTTLRGGKFLVISRLQVCV